MHSRSTWQVNTQAVLGPSHPVLALTHTVTTAPTWLCAPTPAPVQYFVGSPGHLGTSWPAGSWTWGLHPVQAAAHRPAQHQGSRMSMAASCPHDSNSTCYVLPVLQSLAMPVQQPLHPDFSSTPMCMSTCFSLQEDPRAHKAAPTAAPGLTSSSSTNHCRSLKRMRSLRGMRPSVRLASIIHPHQQVKTTA